MVWDVALPCAQSGGWPPLSCGSRWKRQNHRWEKAWDPNPQWESKTEFSSQQCITLVPASTAPKQTLWDSAPSTQDLVPPKVQGAKKRQARKGWPGEPALRGAAPGTLRHHARNPHPVTGDGPWSCRTNQHPAAPPLWASSATAGT